MSAQPTPGHRTQSISSWIFTGIIVVVLIGSAMWWRTRARQAAAPEEHRSEVSIVLPRTRALVEQKTGSLSSYNENISIEELAANLSRHVGHTVDPETFRATGRVVTEEIIPYLWQNAQQGNDDKPYVTQQAIAEVLQRYYPQELLPNADVIFYPEDSELRVVIAETPQDNFRDSGWHWRWIGHFVDTVSPADAERFKELDVYAAEVLSEFLSVFGVALFQLAARRAPAADSDIDTGMVMETLQAMIGWRALQGEGPEQEIPRSLYSEETKMRLVYSLPKPMFREITRQAKLEFTHRPKPEYTQRRVELEIPLGIAGGGVSAGDFDGDGWQDLYFAGNEGGSLYRNVAGRHLEEVGRSTGVNTDGESRAGYFVDFDNDGDMDIYATIVWDSNRLYENDGSGRFRDVTERVGLMSGKYITHEAVWFDMDNDGLLDLYTANFGTWTEGAVPTLGRLNSNAGPNRLYRHRLVGGEHRFEEIGQAMGVDDRGWTHCVGAWDYDQDSYLDLFSLNDFGASLVFRNIGGKAFEEVSRALHLDTTYNAMNFTLLDLNHDGHAAIYVSEIMTLVHRERYIWPTEDTKIKFSEESSKQLRALAQNCLYARRADGTYKDVRGIRMEPADLGWSWDGSTFDYENDGDLDMLVLNGTESDIPTREGGGPDDYVDGRAFLKHHNQQTNVFYASADGYFYDVSDFCPLAFEGNSRGSAFFDFDLDGDLDVAISSYGSEARLFENIQQSKNNWIRFHLTGTKSNRSAVGARLEVRFGDQVRYDQVVSGSGFLSQNPYTLHFGIGKADSVEKLVITWPSGVVQELADLEVNQKHEIVEPK